MMHPLVASLLYLLVLLALAWPLGAFVARVLQGQTTWLELPLGWLERLCYRLTGVEPAREMHWTHYCHALLLFNAAGTLAVYALARLQGWLPQQLSTGVAFNPQKLAGVAPDLAWNTAVSFATNTNWQSYAGESTLGALTQMLGLTVQNFVSAATGLAVFAALARGFARRQARTIGNFWADLTRSVVYVLLPLCCVLALVLVSQGVVQSFAPVVEATMLESRAQSNQGRAQQSIPLGPVASQVAIKQLGTNGGGYFNANAAHPFENPTPLSGWLELLAILLLPAALCLSFGRMVGDVRQGKALLATMVLLFGLMLCLAFVVELDGNPMLRAVGSSGANLEGKEVRFGLSDSVLWAVATTAASNGSVNAMHDSLTPLGGLVPMLLMQLGEVVFGGVGTGLAGLVVFALVAVFVAGLMIGRTPEYLGKKIEAFEMKMVALVILIPPLVTLVGAALAAVLPAGVGAVANPGAHGLSEILYAFSSAGNNNGSAFAGLASNSTFYNTTLGLAMLLARYWLVIPLLAIAGSLAAKKTATPGVGTLPTHTPLFVVLLMVTVLIVGALTFMPALALGPLAEHFSLMGR